MLRQFSLKTHIEILYTVPLLDCDNRQIFYRIIYFIVFASEKQ